MVIHRLSGPRRSLTIYPSWFRRHPARSPPGSGRRSHRDVHAQQRDRRPDHGPHRVTVAALAPRPVPFRVSRERPSSWPWCFHADHPDGRAARSVLHAAPRRRLINTRRCSR
jgi:hypothetical protein